ncbi:biotin/lipoate A/B protein ligase family protein [Paenibacillus sp.]|uniref:lipoate--protein ligase family protein n=1 Tax=Paenibacillus sp. TaxID=58172 RepID=UPI002D74D355|nr:biotin/lipoate A/B protein ligase family protein [Paenibacillus sp.]HZG88015.1 biotin/lipoate A/B protein ligase family protein [Paenibacillus sp.]
MTNEWRLVRSGACAPDYNMAADEAMMKAVGAGEAPPTLRFYGWNPATLSIGYFQKAEDEVDLEEVRRRGLGFVRRPTGGRAVLHDVEVTYSIAVPEKYPGLPTSVTESYRVLSEGLVHGFRALGLDAAMVSLASEEEKAKYASAGSAACFDSPSWYELVVDGRKVAGSAQVRQHGAVLQHGSILLDLDIEQLFSLLRFRSERLRERLAASFADKAAAINDLRAARGLAGVAASDAEAAFADGWARSLGVRFAPQPLSAAEEAETARLVAEKYGTDEWNLRR